MLTTLKFITYYTYKKANNACFSRKGAVVPSVDGGGMISEHQVSKRTLKGGFESCPSYFVSCGLRGRIPPSGVGTVSESV